MARRGCLRGDRVLLLLHRMASRWTPRRLMKVIRTILTCPRCGNEFRRSYVAVGFLNDARRERDEWIERCRNLCDPNPGYWTETLHEARAALAEIKERDE